MSREKGGTGISVGSASILMVFVVLCLTTFAALSLVSARADYRLTEKAAQAAQEYYRADARAEERLLELDGLLAGPGWEAAAREAGFAVRAEAGRAVFAFDVPMDGGRALHVEAARALDGAGAPSGGFERLCWQVRAPEDWAGDEPSGPAGLSNLPAL